LTKRVRNYPRKTAGPVRQPSGYCGRTLAGTINEKRKIFGKNQEKGLPEASLEDVVKLAGLEGAGGYDAWSTGKADPFGFGAVLPEGFQREKGGKVVGFTRAGKGPGIGTLRQMRTNAMKTAGLRFPDTFEVGGGGKKG